MIDKIVKKYKDKIEHPEEHLDEVFPCIKCQVTHVYKREMTYSKTLEIDDPDFLNAKTLQRLKSKVRDKVIQIPCKKKTNDGSEYDSWDYVFNDHDAIGGNLIEERFECPNEIISAWRKHNNLGEYDIMTKDEADRRKSLADGTRIFLGKSLRDHLRGYGYDHTYVDSCYRDSFFSDYVEYKCWYVDVDGRGGPDSENIIYIEKK